MPKPRLHIFICLNVRAPDAPQGCCSARGSEEIYLELKRQVKTHFPGKEVRVTRTGCLGPCEQGVNMVVYPEGIWYHGVTMVDIPDIFQQHLVQGQPVKRLILKEEFL